MFVSPNRFSIIAVITIGIKDDPTPELNELVVIQLTNPKSGAILDPRSSSVNVVIVANDHVGGVLGFTSSSYIAKEGKNSFNVYIPIVHPIVVRKRKVLDYDVIVVAQGDTCPTRILLSSSALYD